MFIRRFVSAVVCASAVLAGFCASASACEPVISHYAVFGTVESRVFEDVPESWLDDGAIIDDEGYEWYYEDRPDLYEGQRVLVFFHDNGTPENLCDDVITAIIPAYGCMKL